MLEVFVGVTDAFGPSEGICSRLTDVKYQMSVNIGRVTSLTGWLFVKMNGAG